MKMRQWVDVIQGPGSWDRIHDALERKDIFGWELPLVPLDGGTVRIFPGTNREVTLEQVQAEARRVIAQIDRGDYEIVNEFED